MPTYDYVCCGCGRKFEVFQSITSEARAICPDCKKVSKTRLIGSGGGIIFKGTGWPGKEIANSTKKQD